MKTIPFKTVAFAVIAALCGATSAFAQNSAPNPPPPAPQQPSGGVGGGQFRNPEEAAKLEQKLHAMTPEQREAFMENHPRIREWFRHHRDEMLARYTRMTPAQQQQFASEHPQFQNFIQNHPEILAKAEANAKEAGPGVFDPNHPRVNEVNGRESNQQQRISQGEANGTLSSSQASQLENGEKRIQTQETADMDQHNGHLTRGEKRRLNREENHESHNIYEDKHEGKH
jgi:hypothetical protein